MSVRIVLPKSAMETKRCHSAICCQKQKHCDLLSGHIYCSWQDSFLIFDLCTCDFSRTVVWNWLSLSRCLFLPVLTVQAFVIHSQRSLKRVCMLACLMYIITYIICCESRWHGCETVSLITDSFESISVATLKPPGEWERWVQPVYSSDQLYTAAALSKRTPSGALRGSSAVRRGEERRGSQASVTQGPCMNIIPNDVVAISE